jgi:2-dehydropantoate 2-reductase
MRIAIFGIGAMGCLFGARLAPAAEVTLIGHWPEQIAALRAGPLHVETAEGKAYDARLNVHDSADGFDAMAGSFDAALILVKAAHTSQAAAGAAQVLRPAGVAVTLQNGIGNYEIIQGQVGEARAVLGTTAQPSAVIAPGLIREGGAGVTHLATRSEVHLQVEALAMLFERGGLQTKIVEDVSGLVWGKLAVNAGINPLAALLRVPNGALLESMEAHTLLIEAAREVQAVALAKGIGLPFEDAAARAEEVARLTAANRNSMLQDVLRGASTEIEAICGAVVREGEAVEVPTPVNKMLYRLIRGLEQSAQQRV